MHPLVEIHRQDFLAQVSLNFVVFSKGAQPFFMLPLLLLLLLLLPLILVLVRVVMVASVL